MARGPGKGKTNNPNGRPKGISNKATIEVREKIKTIIDAETEFVSEVLKDLRQDNPVQYLTIYEKLLSYVTPKKRDITSDDKPISIPQPINITVDSSETAETLKKLRDGAKAD